MLKVGEIQVLGLKNEQRSVVDTATAAHYLNRRPQTLRAWAAFGAGPIKPKRIYGRLAWPVDALKALVDDLPLKVQRR